MKLKSKILSAILALIMITSVLPMSLLTAYAGSQDGGSGSVDVSGSGALTDWSISTNEKDVIVIRASCITDTTSINNMAKISHRYGNGNDKSTVNYPLYMLTGRSTDHDDYYISEPGAIKDKMQTEYNKWKDFSKCKLEYIDSNGRPGTVQAVTVIAGSNEYPYLEDILGRAVNSSNSSKLGDDEYRALWYFYTKMATGVNADTTHGSGGSHLGSTLHRNLIDYVASNSTNAALFQKGYVVALSLAYGFDSPIVKDITNNSSGFTKGNSGLWSNGYTSLVVDKAVVVNNHFASYNRFGIDPNKYRDSDVIITVHAFVDTCRRYDDRVPNNIDPFKEFPIVGNSSGTVAINNNGNGQPISMWWSIFKGMVGDIAPAYSFTDSGRIAKGDILDSNGNQVFTGWGYYEIATNINLEKYIPVFNNQVNIGTEVTYNAYLSTDGTASDEKDSFGNNGRVMTDTVYISKPQDIDKVIKEQPRQTEILDTQKYMYVTVDKQISLSAPAKDTKYNLARLTYQITNANGTYSINSDDEYLENTRHRYTIGTTEVTNGKIATLGTDINAALNSDKMKTYVRSKIKLDDNSIKVGFWGDSNAPDGYYYVYDKYDDTTQIKYNGSSVTTNISGAFIKSGKYKTYNKSYSPSDYTEKSSKYFYIEFPGGRKYPAVYVNDSWYLCPLMYVENILVQYVADYTANTGVDTSNYNNMYQTVTMPEYLLAKNNSTDDFTKTTLYTMIDNYATNTFGTLVHRGYGYANNTVRNKKFTDNDEIKRVFRYNFFLKDSAGTPYKGNSTGTDDKNMGWDKEGYELSSTVSSISGNVRKLGYIDSLEKPVTIFSSRTGTFVDMNLTNNVYKFQSMSGGKSSVGTVNKDGILRTEAYSADIIGYDVGYDSKVSKLFNVNEAYHEITDSSTEYHYYRSEGPVYAKASLGVNIRDNLYYLGKAPIFQILFGSTELSSSKFKESRAKSGYNEAYFQKLVAHYIKYTYNLRGSLASEYTPYAANWVSTSIVGGMTYNSIGKTLPTKVENGVVKTITSIDKNNGFIRFGQSVMSVPDSNGVYEKQPYRVVTRSTDSVNKNSQVPMSISGVITDPKVKRSILSSSAVDAKSWVFTAPYTQSSLDIPIAYTVKSHTTANKNKQALETAYNKSGSKISMFYQYSADDITTGISKYQGSNASSWKYNKVSIAVYPEVRMWAEKDFTGNSTKHKPDSASDYNTITTVGSQLRYIPATTYTTLDFGGLNVNAQVVGTAVAYDTRAKKLATELGTVDTQVLYSGTAINGTISSKASGTITTYALDFRNNGALNGQDIKTAWGNSNYTSSNAASKAMSLILDQFKVSSSANMSIYNGSTLTNVPMDIASTSDADLTAGSIKEGTTRYNVYLRGSQIYEVIVYTKVGTGYVEVIRYRFIDPDGSNERDGYTKLLENGTSIPFWYNTKSCKIAVVNGRYIYNGTTELTATERNNYLAIYNGTDDVTKATFKDLRTLLTNMRLYGNDSVLKNVFEYNTGVDLPNGLVNSTGGTKSYNEDCSVLQIRGYTATISSADSKSTFSEQIPINAGPATPVDKNMYFSKGYKGFINASVEVVAKNDIRAVTGSIIIAKDTVFASDIIKHKVKGSVDEVLVNNAENAEKAVPDFIIGDVPISEALNG